MTKVTDTMPDEPSTPVPNEYKAVAGPKSVTVPLKVWQDTCQITQMLLDIVRTGRSTGRKEWLIPAGSAPYVQKLLDSVHEQNPGE